MVLHMPDASAEYRENIKLVTMLCAYKSFSESMQRSLTHFLTRQATHERGTRFRVLVIRCSFDGCDRCSFDSALIICPQNRADNTTLSNKIGIILLSTRFSVYVALKLNSEPPK